MRSLCKLDISREGSSQFPVFPSEYLEISLFHSRRNTFELAEFESRIRGSRSNKRRIDAMIVPYSLSWGLIRKESLSSTGGERFSFNSRRNRADCVASIPWNSVDDWKIWDAETLNFGRRLFSIVRFYFMGQRSGEKIGRQMIQILDFSWCEYCERVFAERLTFLDDDF